MNIFVMGLSHRILLTYQNDLPWHIEGGGGENTKILLHGRKLCIEKKAFWSAGGFF